MLWIIGTLIATLGFLGCIGWRLTTNRSADRGPATMGAIGALILLALVQVVSATTRVPEGNVGVVYEFGAITGTLDGAGIKVHAPWAEVETVNVKTQIATFGDLYDPKTDELVREGEYPGFDASSKETQAVTVAATLNYAVVAEKADDLLARYGVNWFDAIIPQRMNTYVKTETTREDTADLPAKRDEIETAVQARLANDPVIQDAGIIIIRVAVDNIDLPASFRQAIEEKQVEEQKAQRAVEEQFRRETEAETEAIERVTLAEAGEAEVTIAARAEASRLRTIAEAEADATRARGQAEADANRAIAASLSDEVIRYEAIKNLENVDWGLLPADSDFLLDPANIGNSVG